MIGQNYSDIYVAACGEVLPTRYSGVEHEKNCRQCKGIIALDREAKLRLPPRINRTLAEDLPGSF